jgi:glycosidase
MPQIYSGDEIAMQGGDDPDNRRDFPGGFADGQPDAFVTAGRNPQQEEMYKWVSGLMKLRQTHPSLTAGRQQDVLDEDPSAFAFVRANDISHGCDGTDRVLTVINNADSPKTISLKVESTGLSGCSSAEQIFGSSTAAKINDSFTTTLVAKSMAIYAVR